MILPSPALIHAAWITAAVAAVCLSLCTIHSRKSSTSLRRRASSRPGSAPLHGSTRPPCRDQINNNGIAATPGATPAAKVSPTPSDTAKSCCVVGGADLIRVGDDNDDAATLQDEGGPVTVIEVGTHGPIAPVFPPVPDPMPPRRSLSAKHVRFAERLGRIRSRRWGLLGNDRDEDLEAGPANGKADHDATLWTKTILLGERCRVPSAGDGGDCENGDGDGVVRWKSYRPRQPRSVPVTRSNSFAGVVGGSCRPAAGRGARF